MPQFPATATLIEQARPNAKGEGVIQIHAVGCQHQNRVSEDLVYEVDPEAPYLTYGSGVEGAVGYYLALRSGALDSPSGTPDFPWVARLAPCAKKAV